MAKFRTHYDNLKVARDAPLSVIRAAYKTLTQQYHPDKNVGDEKAVRVMQLINASYDVLSDPERRKRHDEWIRNKEGERPEPEHSSSPPPPNAAPRNAAQGIRIPIAGSTSFGKLAAPGIVAMRELLAGKAEFQSIAPLSTKSWQIVWLVVSVAFLGYLVHDAFQFRWSRDTVSVYQVASSVAGAIALYCAFFLWRWANSPLRPSLILTPLYVIATDYEQIKFWPISDINDVRVTHHHHNGSYTHSTLEMRLGDSPQGFNILTRAKFEEFSTALARFGAALDKAARDGNQGYVTRFDIFADVERVSHPRFSVSQFGPLGASVLGALLAFGLFVGLSGHNLQRPFHQATPYASAPPASTSPPVVTAPPVQSAPRQDYIESHLGHASPKRTGYVPGQKRLNDDGLSTVTVDNGRNDADVLVKLVSLARVPAYPVRVFYIPAFGTFTVEDVTPGRYDVRYLERWSGAMARSDPFSLEQTQRADGIEYSQLTLTLYKVKNGNMQTHRINESEF